MATKAKDTTLKKGKKAITPSNPKPTASISSSNDKEKPAPTTTPSAKPTPNYLKPTFSSKYDTPLNVKKSTKNEDSTSQNHLTLLRRRSLDKSPSGSLKQRTVTSTRPLKSQPISSNRPNLVTLKTGASKSFKPGKKSQISSTVSKPLKRSSSASRKNGISSAPVSSSTSPTYKDKIFESFDHEKKETESIEETLVHDEAEELQLLLDVPEIDIDKYLEAHDIEDQKLVEHFDATIASDEQKVPQETKIEEVGEVQNQLEGEENQRKDDSPKEAIRVLKDDQNIGEQDGFDSLGAGSSEQHVGEEHKRDEEQKDDNGVMSEEGKSVVEGGDENTIERVAAPPEVAPFAQKRLGGQGKKESPPAYNDVIEETKNKLLESRRNKVKALVGAFETVIDYESGSK